MAVCIDGGLCFFAYQGPNKGWTFLSASSTDIQLWRKSVSKRLLSSSLLGTVAALGVALGLAGCISSGQGSGVSAPAVAGAPASSKVPAGMNEKGEVIDSKLVEAGSGQKVKGLNDWEGEIVGKPVPGSKFDQLKIGMGVAQVLSIVGTPTDQGSYTTGKAFIPFYFGADKHRYEMTFKGKGRLIFAGGAGYSTDQNLIWIINSANESGFR
jgi:hypothetical protein